MMDTENYQIEREYIKTVTVTNPKDQRNKGVIIVKFHEKNKDITSNYVNVLKKDDSMGFKKSLTNQRKNFANMFVLAVFEENLDNHGTFCIDIPVIRSPMVILDVNVFIRNCLTNFWALFT